MNQLIVAVTLLFSITSLAGGEKIPWTVESLGDEALLKHLGDFSVFDRTHHDWPKITSELISSAHKNGMLVTETTASFTKLAAVAANFDHHCEAKDQIAAIEGVTQFFLATQYVHEDIISGIIQSPYELNSDGLLRIKSVIGFIEKFERGLSSKNRLDLYYFLRKFLGEAQNSHDGQWGAIVKDLIPAAQKLKMSLHLKHGLENLVLRSGLPQYCASALESLFFPKGQSSTTD